MHWLNATICSRGTGLSGALVAALLRSAGSGRRRPGCRPGHPPATSSGGEPASRCHGSASRLWRLALGTLPAALILVQIASGMTRRLEADSDTTRSEVTDMAGRKVKIPRQIRSIATLGPVPVLNGFLFAFGEGGKIVNGLPDFARSPRYKYQGVFAPTLATKPKMQGNNREPNLEELLKSSPDLVLTMDRESIEPLERNGLAVVYLSWRQPEDVKRLMRLLGEVLNKRSSAEQYCRYFDQTVARVRHTVGSLAPGKRPKVLFCSLKSLTQQHLIAEWWIDTAGGVSVTNNGRTTESFTFSLEQMLFWDPDILIVATPDDLKEIYRDPRYGKMKAVTAHRVYVAPIAAHLWANRSVEQPLTLLWAAKTFYPQQFKGMDLHREVRRFYEKFFHYRLSDRQVTEILNGIP